MQASSYSKYKLPKNVTDTSKNPFSNKELYSCIFRDLRFAVVTACITTENTEAILCPSNPDLLTLTGIAYVIH